jgi:hypothetical protein
MKTAKTVLITTLLCFGLVMYSLSSGMALEVENPSGDKGRLKEYHDWHFYVSLYSWLYALQGDVTARGRTSDVDVKLDDTLKLLDELELVFMGRFEVSKGPWGFLLDGNFLRLEDSAERQGSIQVPILVPSEVPLQGRIGILRCVRISQRCREHAATDPGGAGRGPLYLFAHKSGS